MKFATLLRSVAYTRTELFFQRFNNETNDSKGNENIICTTPASILYKSIAGRYRPVSYPDGPITARYRFIKNAYWDGDSLQSHIDCFGIIDAYLGGICSAETQSGCLDENTECNDSICQCIAGFADINGTCKAGKPSIAHTGRFSSCIPCYYSF